MYHSFLPLLILLFCHFCEASERVRHIPMLKDQIATIRTAIGVATIVQISESPNSVVVGDQDSFKVEYLDQAITIKPLRPGAKSNLYVYTDWQRYNVQLITGAEPIADYVVYLDHPNLKIQSAGPPIAWTDLKLSMKNEMLQLGVKKVGTTADLVFVEFEINSESAVNIDPAWIWITQGKLVRPIRNLILSGLQAGPNLIITGLIQIKRSDVREREPFRIELRWKKKTWIVVPKVVAWK